MPSQYVTVTATKLLNILGKPILSGKLTITATDGEDHPLNFEFLGGGQVINPTVTVPIRNGAIAPVRLPDPTQTNPLNILYHFHFCDDTSGEESDIALVTVTGPTWTLDNYNSAIHSVVLPRVLATGPPGPPGASIAFEVTTSGVVSAYSCVAMIGGRALTADASISVHAGRVLGIAGNSAQAGGVVVVQAEGPITNAAWNWSDGPIFLGTSGALTQTPPTSGFLQEMGVSTNPTTVLIRLQSPLVFA